MKSSLIILLPTCKHGHYSLWQFHFHEWGHCERRDRGELRYNSQDTPFHCMCHCTRMTHHTDHCYWQTVLIANTTQADIIWHKAASIQVTWPCTQLAVQIYTIWGVNKHNLQCKFVCAFWSIISDRPSGKKNKSSVEHNLHGTTQVMSVPAKWHFILSLAGFTQHCKQAAATVTN